MAALRHQSALASVIDFGSQGPLFADAEKRARAVARFYDVIGHFAAIETNNPYNRAALIRLTFEYARSANRRIGSWLSSSNRSPLVCSMAKWRIPTPALTRPFMGSD
ncbi:hypothetical protein B0T18DRAFT_397018 [Schizothecium vesticola]|uniref:Uncharacterized protein n=1 Tax=Schizothecium vesticola TaxID=314040 RepID=A0AA40F9B6_9PEZI|nr:hypothetical protein B0T18DRAFT_397018 [Schizothecium vesticola]